MSRERIRWGNLRTHWVVPLLVLPVFIGIGVFAYLPAWQAIVHSFYTWDGLYTESFTGLDNFRRLLGNLDQWGPFLAGVALTGLSGLLDTFRYRKVLRALGTVALAYTSVLLVRDGMTRFSGMDPVQVRHHLSTLLVLAGIGAVMALLAWKSDGSTRSTRTKTLVFFSYLLPILAMLNYMVSVQKFGDSLLWLSFRLIFILILANLLKMWPSIFTAVCIHRMRSDRWQYIYRVLFVIPMIIPQMVGLLIWKFFYDPNVGALNKIFIATGLDRVMIWLDTWVLHLGVFVDPFKPAWLGDPRLIVTALVFWGFPWVGVVGVLIYLAGLQNISNDVYEASDLDGVGWWGRFRHIEFPLIMTQVRLNLILMIVGTFQAYGFQLILLGPAGGPENKGLTPGLYMFYQAFLQTNYGYACAIGLILFFLIMILTIVNQKYVRVDK